MTYVYDVCMTYCLIDMIMIPDYVPYDYHLLTSCMTYYMTYDVCMTYVYDV